MLFHLIHCIRNYGDWEGRRRDLKRLVRETIEAEGGDVLRITMIGLLVRSPFPALGYQPIYLRADCRYPEDSGAWFIRDVAGTPAMWVWRSDIESPSLPAPRDDGAFVDNRILALPSWFAKAGYLALIAGLLGWFWYLFAGS